MIKRALFRFPAFKDEPKLDCEEMIILSQVEDV